MKPSCTGLVYKSLAIAAMAALGGGVRDVAGCRRPADCYAVARI